MIAFAADLTVVVAVQTSKYGKGSYGVNHYSQVATLDLAGGFAPAVGLSASIDIVGQDFFDGNLALVVTFAGALSVQIDLGAGGLAPVVAFSGALTFDLVLGGDIAPQIALDGSLTLDLPLEGDWPIQIGLACPGLISGPLWAETEPCPVAPWTPEEPCPVAPWTPGEPCAIIEWRESELCDG